MRTTPPILESFLEMGPSRASIQWQFEKSTTGSVQSVAVRCPKIYGSVHHYLHPGQHRRVIKGMIAKRCQISHWANFIVSPNENHLLDGSLYYT